ncbi:hypothetical protein K492DRAFT_45794 [Lichtheimia hyalospora FSU 10163]|nr:hypothetical protein K492DRAFT_45794 [Lichtheimia hyalospora FSU 10163]
MVPSHFQLLPIPLHTNDTPAPAHHFHLSIFLIRVDLTELRSKADKSVHEPHILYLFPSFHCRTLPFKIVIMNHGVLKKQRQNQRFPPPNQAQPPSISTRHRESKYLPSFFFWCFHRLYNFPPLPFSGPALFITDHALLELQWMYKKWHAKRHRLST